MDGERFEWCRRQECGKHIGEEEVGVLKDPPDAVGRVRVTLHTEIAEGHLAQSELIVTNNHFGGLCGAV